MLFPYIGDQALHLGHILKQSYLVCMMVKNEYRYLTRIKPKREEMRKNYPDVRLDINGTPRTYH